MQRCHLFAEFDQRLKIFHYRLFLDRVRVSKFMLNGKAGITGRRIRLRPESKRRKGHHYV